MIDLDRTFNYHPPTDNQFERFVLIREGARQWVRIVENLCPESRERSLALTNLQQAVMWANASIAINESGV